MIRYFLVVVFFVVCLFVISNVITNQCYPFKSHNVKLTFLFHISLQYELLFSVPDDNDPAILVVKSLIESYPKVDAKLFIGKYNNIVSM